MQKERDYKPWYWLNKEASTFLSRGYLEEGQSTQDKIKSWGDFCEDRLGIEGWSDKFVENMSKGWYAPSSPIWANFASDRGLPISCFGSTIGDNMEDIFTKVSEAGMMTKNGGGTSANFSELRPRGTKITAGGESSGAVHFMELFSSVMEVVSQGNVRRGSFASYLDIEHGDIEEFLKIQSDGHKIQNLSIGVNVGDDWMKSMIEGDKEKRALWAKVIKKRFETGYPYIMFKDNANNNAPQVYKDKGKTIHASNLCLVGDTKVTISLGNDGKEEATLEISELIMLMENGLYDEVFVKSYDGVSDVWSKITNGKRTGSTDELIEIESENGNIIRCTPNHKILTKNRGWVKAINLKEDDKLIEE